LDVTLPQRLQAWDAQRILHLRFSEQMTASSIAAKLRISPVVVAAILEAYASREHVPANIVPGERTKETARLGRVKTGYK